MKNIIGLIFVGLAASFSFGDPLPESDRIILTNHISTDYAELYCYRLDGRELAVFVNEKYKAFVISTETEKYIWHDRACGVE